MSELPAGRAVMFTTYDPVTRRATCGGCNRVVATGQESCVCGAVFTVTLRSSFGDATASEIGERQLERP